MTTAKQRAACPIGLSAPRGAHAPADGVNAAVGPCRDLELRRSVGMTSGVARNSVESSALRRRGARGAL
jgi:hypothetical protein